MLKVIGAGFGRTGTESLKRALEMLGFGRCHHMYEVMPDPVQYAAWERMVHGEEPPDWDALYEGFGAAVDWPTCSFWRELAPHYPEAKFVLSRRSTENWLASFSKTILPHLLERRRTGETRIMGYELIARQTFGGRPDDMDHAGAIFEAHNAAVIAGLPPERLLVYDLGSGWGPLCTFLGLPEPPEPYPSGNATEEFHRRTNAARAERAARGG